MEQNIFLQEIFKLFFIYTKNTLNVLMALIKFIRGNLMKYQKKVLKK